jgi:DNA-binding response OmpR family regulator
MSEQPVLVVDDDSKIVDLVSVYLERAGYQVVTASDGHEALRQVRDHHPRLVVLDVMLPGIDGLLVARQLGIDSGHVPILMMSARGTVDDRIKGLVEGADDYLAKPFSPAEMVARVSALLRRTGADAPAKLLLHLDLTVDLERHQVWRGKEPLRLSAVEYRILVALLQARGRVMSRDQLADVVQGLDGAVLSRSIDVYVRRLRAKLGDDAARSRYVASVRGVGYRSAT